MDWNFAPTNDAPGRYAKVVAGATFMLYWGLHSFPAKDRFPVTLGSGSYPSSSSQEHPLPNHPYLPFLQSVLTPTRLKHSLGVMQVMEELAPVYGLDSDQAQTIGLLHDAGKDLPQEQIKVLIHEGKIQINHPSDTNYVLYLHGPVGAYFVQKSLGIDEPMVLGAIAAHTFYGDGPYFEHTMTWCLRFADILEPNRDWEKESILRDCTIQLRKYAYDGQMAAGKYLQADSLIRWFESKGYPVHPNLLRVKNEYYKEVKDDRQHLA